MRPENFFIKVHPKFDKNLPVLIRVITDLNTPLIRKRNLIGFAKTK